MKFFKLYTFLLLLLSLRSTAGICTAKSSSNWSLTSTWSTSSVPGCNDIIVIPANFTVTINSTINLTGGGCSGTSIEIYGTLFISGNSSKLDLVSTSTINIYPGGKITTDQPGNNSQKITIGSGAAEWSSNDGDLYGPWTLTNGSSVSSAILPIELSYFDGNVLANNTVNLKWQTASEKNNDFFEIQRSSDGFIFERIAIINSKSPDGNSLQLLNYETTDQNPLSGTNYYRLKQVDFSGEFTYSKIISLIQNRELNVSFLLIPNPNDGEFYVNVTGVENNHEVEVFIYDNKQSLVYHAETNIQSIQNKTFNFRLHEDLNKGLYNVVFVLEEIKYKCNLIIQ